MLAVNEYTSICTWIGLNVYILREERVRERDRQRGSDRETVLHSFSAFLVNSGLDMDQITLNACLYNSRPITDRGRSLECAPLCYLFLPVLHLCGGRGKRKSHCVSHAQVEKLFRSGNVTKRILAEIASCSCCRENVKRCLSRRVRKRERKGGR